MSLRPVKFTICPGVLFTIAPLPRYVLIAKPTRRPPGFAKAKDNKKGQADKGGDQMQKGRAQNLHSPSCLPDNAGRDGRPSKR